MDGLISTGLEELQRAVIQVLHASLNAELILQTSAWTQRDMDFASAMSFAYEPLLIEGIDSSNFYPGHNPTLIDAPADRYPNCSAMAGRANPRGGDASRDQGEIFDRSLWVEIMCKSANSEREVNSRTQRTADSVLNILAKDRTLGGIATELGSTPTVDLSNVFQVAPPKGTRAERHLWQGARLAYSLEKEFSYGLSMH